MIHLEILFSYYLNAVKCVFHVKKKKPPQNYTVSPGLQKILFMKISQVGFGSRPPGKLFPLSQSSLDGCHQPWDLSNQESLWFKWVGQHISIACTSLLVPETLSLLRVASLSRSLVYLLQHLSRCELLIVGVVGRTQGDAGNRNGECAVWV